MSTLSELFDRDPLSLTREDRMQIIEFLQKQLEAFNAGNKSAAKPEKPKAVSLNKKSTDVGKAKISVSDILEGFE